MEGVESPSKAEDQELALKVCLLPSRLAQRNSSVPGHFALQLPACCELKISADIEAARGLHIHRRQQGGSAGGSFVGVVALISPQSGAGAPVVDSLRGRETSEDILEEFPSQVAGNHLKPRGFLGEPSALPAECWMGQEVHMDCTSSPAGTSRPLGIGRSEVPLVLPVQMSCR